MKEYVKPDVEVILFENEVFTTSTSTCNCHYDIANNDLSLSGTSCKIAETGSASENPFGIDAPQWGLDG